MRVLIIDNYDSFTFNLYQYVGELLGHMNQPFVLDVVRNDELSMREIEERAYGRIIISPGPGEPSDTNYFGVCAEVIQNIGVSVPILGVCLGMQGIADVFGGTVVCAPLPMHGKTSILSHDEKGIFSNLPQDIEVMRYHSLIVKPDSIPNCFDISAETVDTKEIMGLRHKKYPIEGVQFHPESFATEGGKIMLKNFINQ